MQYAYLGETTAHMKSQDISSGLDTAGGWRSWANGQPQGIMKRFQESGLQVIICED